MHGIRSIGYPCEISDLQIFVQPVRCLRSESKSFIIRSLRRLSRHSYIKSSRSDIRTSFRTYGFALCRVRCPQSELDVAYVRASCRAGGLAVQYSSDIGRYNILGRHPVRLISPQSANKGRSREKVLLTGNRWHMETARWRDAARFVSLQRNA
jgi:hypothetical protein